MGWKFGSEFVAMGRVGRIYHETLPVHSEFPRKGSIHHLSQGESKDPPIS